MNESNLNEDRLSRLPDSILSNILSFLPTKEAVATSILSQRWKLVWTSLRNLCFDDRLCTDYIRSRGNLTDESLDSFENFVNGLLLYDLSDVGKFSLHCSKLRDLSRLKFWVSSAIMRNVREIELSIERHKRVELPESICTSKTLVVLKLNSDFVIPVPSSGMCFPSVKILHVKMFHPDSNLTEKLFSICPELEDLFIQGNLKSYGYMTKFNISSPTLKRLKLIFRKYNFTCTRLQQEQEHQIAVKAPNLELLDIRDYNPVSYVMHELHSLTKVFVDITSVFMEDFDPAHCVVQILKGITNTKFLSFSKSTMSALDCGFEDFFPTFPDLTFLEVECGEFKSRFLPIILSNTPKLEAFVFEKDAFVDFRRTEPLCVPHCLLSHIKKIEIRGFEGQKDQVELIKYMLKNGEVLNTMIIKFQKSWSEEMGS